MRSIRTPSDTLPRPVSPLDRVRYAAGGPAPPCDEGVRTAWHRTERPPKANVTLEWMRSRPEGLFRCKTPQGWWFQMPASYLVVDLFDFCLSPGEGRYRGSEPPRSAEPGRGGYWRWQSR